MRDFTCLVVTAVYVPSTAAFNDRIGYSVAVSFVCSRDLNNGNLLDKLNFVNVLFEMPGEQRKTLNDLTISDLEERLRDRDLPVSGNKNELIARLLQADPGIENNINDAEVSDEVEHATYKSFLAGPSREDADAPMHKE